MAIRIRDPFALSRSFWQMPSVWDMDLIDSSDQGITMYETDDAIIVEANVAGVPENKVEISIEGGTWTIKASHEETEEEKQKRKIVYKQARAYQYVYSANLPTSVKSDEAKAEIENGILQLTLPKQEEAKPKKIEISVKK